MISPRGYAIQFALPISLPSPLSLPAPGWFQGDLHKQGLIRLAKLFAVFDAAPVLKLPQNKSRTVSVDLLLMVEKALEEAPPCPAHHDVVQKVDYLVTQHWMRLLLWQQAMSRGLLSSVSLFNSMRVTFPTYFARDILGSVAGIPADAFACGGEALVVSPTSDSSHSKLTRIDGSRLSSSKSNSLADVIFCSPETSDARANGIGPHDLLHTLYKTIAPCLEKRPLHLSLLRKKAGEVLLRSPARLELLDSWTDDEKCAKTVNQGYIALNQNQNPYQSTVKGNHRIRTTGIE